MPLSEDEQRILQEIEQQFYESDPEFAGELGKHSVYAHCLRQMKWAGLAFVVGVVILVAALATATTFLVAFGGFVVHARCRAVVRAQPAEAGPGRHAAAVAILRAGGLREYFGNTSQRMRERFRRDDDSASPRQLGG